MPSKKAPPAVKKAPTTAAAKRPPSTTSTLLDKPKRKRPIATPEQGPEYQAILDHAYERKLSVSEVRGVKKNKVTGAPLTGSTGGNLNPSPATRLKPGEGRDTLLAKKAAKEGKTLAEYKAARREALAVNALDAEERKRLAKEAGMTPLEFLLSIMCDAEEKLGVRINVATSVLPYFHRKMPIAVDNGAGGPVGVYTKEQLSRLNTAELQALEQLMLKLGNDFPVPSVPANAASSPEALVTAMDPSARDAAIIMAQQAQFNTVSNLAQGLVIGTAVAEAQKEDGE